MRYRPRSSVRRTRRSIRRTFWKNRRGLRLRRRSGSFF